MSVWIMNCKKEVFMIRILVFCTSYFHIFSCIRTEYGDLRSKSLYSVQIQENTDQKKLRIWKLFTQCMLSRVKGLKDNLKLEV